MAAKTNVEGNLEVDRSTSKEESSIDNLLSLIVNCHAEPPSYFDMITGVASQRLPPDAEFST